MKLISVLYAHIGQAFSYAYMVKDNGHVQVRPGESLAHHPLATILVQNLLHVLDEVVELALELLPVFLRGIFGIEEWMN